MSAVVECNCGMCGGVGWIDFPAVIGGEEHAFPWGRCPDCFKRHDKIHNYEGDSERWLMRRLPGTSRSDIRWQRRRVALLVGRATRRAAR